jgi:D-cysteine desulfhydrase
MNLERFARRRYTHAATPIEPLNGLSSHLGGPTLWIKRDDLTGLAGGGNKTRKLEFLVADALAQGCDTLITTGAVQSNHCRLTLAAAAKERLACRLVLERSAADNYDPRAGGNNFLYGLLGVERVSVVDAPADVDQAMSQIGDDLARVGRKAYVIPRGGSTPLGALGYVNCAKELLAQTRDMDLVLDHIICASGSGGTQAGLLAGLVGNCADTQLTGISVRRLRTEQESVVHAYAGQVADLLGLVPIPRQLVQALDEWVGLGYSHASEEMIAAVRLVARLDGVLLDPIYTGRAMAALIDLIRRGDFAKGENVLFLHTGGLPALCLYQSVLQA